MKRRELFEALAAMLPLGALAIVPERKPGPRPKYARSKQLRWMIIHPSHDAQLASHHEYGQPCAICSTTGVPASLWYSRK